MRLLSLAGIVAVAPLVLLLSGCTGPAPVTPVAKVVNQVSCPPYDRPPASAGRVPEGFVPVAAYLCVGVDIAEGTVAPGPSAVKATGDFSVVLAALAQPNDGAPPNLACPAMAQIVPELWLTDHSGRVIHVHWPRDACGFTKPGVAKALKGLADEGSVPIR